MTIFERLAEFINPSANPDLEPAFSHHHQHLPTLWLLGKTGAGKSSLIQAITGDSAIEIGNGFRPCTMSSFSYEHPQQKPLLRFLDTRGLAESDYDPQQDIEACEKSSHALIVVMKLDDPEQSAVLKTLKTIKKSGKIQHLLLVHTGKQLIDDEHECQRCIDYNTEQVVAIWGSVETIALDLVTQDRDTLALEQLKQKLTDILPLISYVMDVQAQSDHESRNFLTLRKEVLWYAGTAGATDAIPGLGLISVPVIQGKMLHSVANQYGMPWGRQEVAEFFTTLGAGFAAQYAVKFGIRQLVKWIPVYGQTVGSATAAAMSFASTYALGRVASLYLYKKNQGETASMDELKALYETAFTDIKKAVDRETPPK